MITEDDNDVRVYSTDGSVNIYTWKSRGGAAALSDYTVNRNHVICQGAEDKAMKEQKKSVVQLV